MKQAQNPNFLIGKHGKGHAAARAVSKKREVAHG
jgi:hypothetical protein